MFSQLAAENAQSVQTKTLVPSRLCVVLTVIAHNLTWP
ncbi:hypothetical protein BOO71_0007813 [Deinococcus marmoris]|uniref:Uncharacterized protein n=1 Tax=Deinococcus marmoris TaxID=249408 RepID=A0A1U7NXL9_9DEIO|nr:hypothetical protein BOO71_0007813 [Deinococcus marmoris]